MKLFSSLFALLFSLPAFASNAGSWLGSGTARSATGWTATCFRLQIEVEESATEFRLAGGYYRCGRDETYLPELVLERRGNQLFHGGVMVGSVNAKGFRISLPEPGNFDVFSGELSAEGLFFYREIQDEKEQMLYRVSGLLK